MKNLQKIALITIILILICGCVSKNTPVTPPTQTLPPGTNHLVINEIMAGKTGNNNYDFIELYNPTLEILDLEGYSLWYQLNDDQSDTLLYSWKTSTLVPPHGHYLLLREGQETGITPDAFFDYSLVPQRGSLALRLGGSPIIDQVAWGDSTSPLVEGSAALAFLNDQSLERLPGADKGNGQDTNNNAVDLIRNPSPNPQNSASPAAPTIENDLQIILEVPQQTTPGGTLEYEITITNTGKEALKNVIAYFPSHTDLVYQSGSLEPTLADEWFQFPIGDLDAESLTALNVVFKTPMKYTTIEIQGIHVEAQGLTTPVFGSTLRTILTGGSIPIGIARTMLGNEAVIVEGTATMYTGGYYAGSSGVKFYLEDGTGGVQVYVPGGNDKVNIPLGAVVQVKGIPQLYRGTIELVPGIEDIKVIKPPEQNLPWEPAMATVESVQVEENGYIGKLATLSGEVTRVEEFSYSYEIDLLDDGNLIGAYVDKLTEINVEAIEVGQYYQLTGIIEKLDDKIQINPRVQTDLEEIQPPTVTLQAKIPVNYDPANPVDIQIMVNNHQVDPIQDLTLSLAIPDGFTITNLSEEAENDGSRITWTISELAGSGSETTLTITGAVSESLDHLVLDDYILSYGTEHTSIRGEIMYSFPGETVPVWAIQGPSTRSPYLLQQVQTSGVVTGVFPEMEGFWIQGDADEDVRTSHGLFIYTQTIGLDITVGDQVNVSGIVHEPHSETQLFLEELEVTASNQPLPTMVSLAPPVDEIESVSYCEAFEGMLVQVNGNARAVSSTNKYGETALVLADQDVEHLMQGEANGMAIRLDDGSFVTHTDQSTMSYAVSTGDLISGIKGVLAYNYGYYKIEPLTPPLVSRQEVILQELAPTESNQFRVMTWNVENLFDYIEPHPTSPALPTVAEYHEWLEKIANNILLAGFPDVIALQEVEHIGVLEDIANTALLADIGYQPVLMEGFDSRGIDVGYLVRGDVQIVEVQQFPAPNELTSRPPLQLEVQIENDGKTYSIYLLNNHFLAMSGGEKSTEPRRIAQAQWNADLMDQILVNHQDALVIVLGDLNSYYNSPPIEVLQSSGLTHVLDQLEPEERYTYIYQGIAQVLDHILVNDALAEALIRVDILHTNSDFPLQTPGDTSALHKSDHDPLIVTFGF